MSLGGCLKKTGCGCLIVTTMAFLTVLSAIAFIVTGAWVYLYDHLGWAFKAADKHGLIHLPWYLKL